jgi:hypothetical protein
MAEKVAKLGVEREKDFMYFVKDGGVWKVPRKRPGITTKGKSEKVADGGFEIDTDYIYFLDRDGDVSRAERAVGGQKRKKARPAPKRGTSRPVKKAAKKVGSAGKAAGKAATKSAAKRGAVKPKKAAKPAKPTKKRGRR